MLRWIPFLLYVAVVAAVARLFPHTDGGVFAAKGVPFLPFIFSGGGDSTPKPAPAPAPAPAPPPQSAPPQSSSDTALTSTPDSSKTTTKKPGLEATVLTSPLGTQGDDSQKKKKALLGA